MTDLYPVLSVEEAQELVLGFFERLEPERVRLLEALGRVLAEDVYARVDIPPHANSAMDGYAVQAADTAGATAESPRRLSVVGDLGAGYVSSTSVQPGTAIRIMTGAPLPRGADAVVRFEDTDRAGDWVEVKVEVPVGKDTRAAGEDVQKGQLVLPQGSLMRAQEVGMAATLGREEVAVYRRPVVGILATGDEVVEVGQALAPGKIWNSNSYSNGAQVLQCGGIPLMMGIARDDIQELTDKIRMGLARGVDLLLTSGGVSVGDFDVVKEVLAAEGEISFWRVRMKPGKPLAFGHIQGMPLLGLPGNPVSAMISFELFARPAILKMQGITDWARATVEAVFMDEVAHKDDRRHYLRVRLEQGAGEWRAHLTGEQGSGILSSMIEADGLAVIPEEWSDVSPGSRVTVLLLEGQGSFATQPPSLGEGERRAE